LTQTLEDLGHIDIVLFWGTVGHDDENTESSTHILDGLSLTGSGRSSWSTTEVHVKSLGKSDITSICEWSNTESLFGTEELIRVVDSPVSDLDLEMFKFISPIDTDLLLPVEISNIGDFSETWLAGKIVEEIELMDLDCNQGLNFGTDKFGLTTLETHNTEMV
jgi:hypothetical protein